MCRRTFPPEAIRFAQNPHRHESVDRDHCVRGSRSAYASHRFVADAPKRRRSQEFTCKPFQQRVWHIIRRNSLAAVSLVVDLFIFNNMRQIMMQRHVMHTQKHEIKSLPIMTLSLSNIICIKSAKVLYFPTCIVKLRMTLVPPENQIGFKTRVV